MADEGMRFEYDGSWYDLVLEKLTLGEAKTVKELTGMNLAPALNAATEMDPDVLGALVLVSVQRTRPEVTVDDIGAVSLVGFLSGETGEAEDGAQSPPDVPAVAA